MNDDNSGGKERANAAESPTESNTGHRRATGSRRSFLATVGAAGAGALAGCVTERSASGFDRIPPEENTQWGETIDIGFGEVSTFVSVDPDSGEKLAGVEMTPGVLSGEGNEHVKCVLKFPETDDVPFTWLGLDWEPGGHYPGDTYAIPHFDFHFYTVPNQVIREVPNIAMPPEAYDDLYTYPMPEDQIPPDYFRTNYVFGYMGEHLYEETAPEYNGGTFGSTFVFGHWDGQLIFMEPMITVPYFEQLMSDDEPELAQLEGVGKRDNRELSMPERFPEAGEYPTEYTVQYHEDRGVFTIVQHAFEEFEASEGLPSDADTSASWTEEPVEINEIRPGQGLKTVVAGGDGADSGTGGGHHGGSDADETVVVAPGGDLVFEPETLEIAPGDTVLFEWDADFHNVVPTDQPADASWEGEPEISDAGHTHSHTFEVEGQYDYVCEPHESQAMVGTIVVGDE